MFRSDARASRCPRADAPDLLALRALGCDHAEGHLIARPMSAGDVPIWLAAHPAVPYEHD